MLEEEPIFPLLDELLNYLDIEDIDYNYGLFEASCCGKYYRVDFKIDNDVYNLAVNEFITIKRIDSPKLFISMSGNLDLEQIKKIIKFIKEL